MLRRHPLFQEILARGERSGATIFWKHHDAGKPQDLSVQGNGSCHRGEGPIPALAVAFQIGPPGRNASAPCALQVFHSRRSGRPGSQLFYPVARLHYAAASHLLGDQDRPMQLLIGNLSRVVLYCQCAGSAGKKFHSEAQVHCLACSGADAGNRQITRSLSGDDLRGLPCGCALGHWPFVTLR